MSDIPSRTAGKRGVRESHAPDELKFHNLPGNGQIMDVEGPIPPNADVGGGIDNWGMLGNGPDPENTPCFPDGAGCCGLSGTQHLRMAQAVTGIVNGVPTFEPGFIVPTTPQTQNWYIQYGKANGETGSCPDNGVDNWNLMVWFYQNQKQLFGPDSEFCFAELDMTRGPAYLRQMMIKCNGVLCAVTLNPDADNQFNNFIPWRLDPNDMPDPTMGHDIVLAAYGARPKGAEEWPIANIPPDADWWLSWGRWQASTVNWDAVINQGGCITDSWVFLTRELAERNGVNFDAAVAIIEKMIHGTVTPAPVVASTIALPPDGWERDKHLFHLVVPPHTVRWFPAGEDCTDSVDGDVFLIDHGNWEDDIIKIAQEALADMEHELKDYTWCAHTAFRRGQLEGRDALSQMNFSGYNRAAVNDYKHHLYAVVHFNVSDEQRATAVEYDESCEDLEYDWLQYPPFLFDGVTGAQLACTWGDMIICSTKETIVCMGLGLMPDRIPSAVVPARWAFWVDAKSPPTVGPPAKLILTVEDPQPNQ